MALILPQRHITFNRYPLLKEFGVPVFSENTSPANDHPVHNVAIINLMPKPLKRAQDFVLGLGQTNHLIRPVVINTSIKRSKHDGSAHLRFPKDALRDLRSRDDITAVIFKGASIDDLPYDQVHGLDELTTTMDWASENTGGCLHICYSAMAALHHNYGIEKHVATEKIIGVFKFATQQNDPLLAAWDQSVGIPVGRLGYVLDSDINQINSLEVLATAPDMPDEAQAALLRDNNGNYYSFNHPEYGPKAIEGEYKRDLETPQGGFTTPEPTGDYIIPEGQHAPWKPSFIKLLDAFITQADARKSSHPSELKPQDQQTEFQPNLEYA